MSDPTAMPFVLASGSPRRADLLREAGYVFTTDPPDVDESDLPPALAGTDVPTYLAFAKLAAVASRRRDVVILAADTVVLLDGEVIGKPADAADAAGLIARLAGRTHAVVTSVAVHAPLEGLTRGVAVRTAVTMRPLPHREIADYVSTGQWAGKAGGYGLQDESLRSDPFITDYDGCRTNVIGLPMTTTARLLGGVGITPWRPGRSCDAVR